MGNLLSRFVLQPYILSGYIIFVEDLRINRSKAFGADIVADIINIEGAQGKVHDRFHS